MLPPNEAQSVDEERHRGENSWEENRKRKPCESGPGNDSNECTAVNSSAWNGLRQRRRYRPYATRSSLPSPWLEG